MAFYVILLVIFGNFIFPAGFVILNYEVDFDMPIILGRPFMAMVRAMVNMEKREFIFRVSKKEVTFNI